MLYIFISVPKDILRLTHTQPFIFTLQNARVCESRFAHGMRQCVWVCVCVTIWFAIALATAARAQRQRKIFKRKLFSHRKYLECTKHIRPHVAARAHRRIALPTQQCTKFTIQLTTHAICSPVNSPVLFVEFPKCSHTHEHTKRGCPKMLTV